MLDTLKQTIAEKTVLDRVLTISPTERVERLRSALFSIEDTVSIDWGRIEVRVMKETEGEPMITRRAKVFAAVVRGMPIDIYPDEIFVGYTGPGPRCANVNPLSALSVASQTQAQALASRESTRPEPSGLSRDEAKELVEELIPYWQEQGRIGEKAHVHYGHNIHDHKKVVEKGFLGIKREAEEALASLDDSAQDFTRKQQFLEGVILAMEAAAELGSRFAARARELAETEADSESRAELLRIADVCDHVPAKPARTFHEALQSYYIAWFLTIWELSYDMGSCMGRIDQYLYPYYIRDIEAGRITKAEAQELLDCYFLKLAKCNGNPTNASIGVGGVDARGMDATNELSYMLIEAMMHTRLVSPYLAVLVHSKSPDALFIKAAELGALGTGHPQFINYDIMVAQALARGDRGGPAITLEDARSASNVGCIELVIPGKDSGYMYYTGSTNLALALELALNNGIRRSDGRKMGAETGNPRKFETFADLGAAFTEQVKWMRKQIEDRGHRQERKVIDLSPTVYESSLIEGCIESATCREEGGAHYNFNTGAVVSGSTDVGDSLAAIEKLVFEDKTLTMSQLCDALESGFEGHEDIRKLCLAAPKFGNDDDRTDAHAAWVLHQWAAEFTKMRNLRGGSGCPGGSPMWHYVPEGRIVGALPSGRGPGEPLADAASPSSGMDLKGPTAVLKSMGKVDHVEILGGVILNMRVDPAVAADREGIGRLADLIRTFVDQKVFHVQINIISTDTLKAAQREPEKHRDLVVKVAGYSAYFTQLTKNLQDTIIRRTVHGL